MDLAKISVWRQSWLRPAKPASLAGLSRMAVRTNRGLSDRTSPNWQVWRDLSKSRFFGVGPAKPWIQVLYIDHFQLPPRWKMTGQDGDPFGDLRWRWPSKRSNFEKNLLIQKSRIQPEKRTFFSFTLENPRKSAFFFASDLCCMPRGAIIDLHGIQHFFSIFLGGQKSRNFRNFSDFSGPEKSRFFWLPTAVRTDLPNLPKSRLLARWLDLSLRRMVLAKPAKPAKISTFGQKSTFWRFCDFSGFFGFFRICQDLSGFATFRTFADFSANLTKSTILDTSKPDVWGPKISLLFGHLFRHAATHETACVGCDICAIFLSFLCAKKLEKYISLASTTLVTAG